MNKIGDWFGEFIMKVFLMVVFWGPMVIGLYLLERFVKWAWQG